MSADVGDFISLALEAYSKWKGYKEDHVLTLDELADLSNFLFTNIIKKFNAGSIAVAKI